MGLIITRGTLELLLDEVHRKVGVDLRVCMPARVVQWMPPTTGPRPTPARALVQVDLKYAREARAGDAQPDGTGVPEVPGPATDPREPGELVGNYPPILVPVHYPGPWGMWARGPLLPGELGKLVWCDRSIDTWQIEGGGPAGPVDPGLSHMHGGMTGGPLNDAWFEPGVRSGASMLAGPPGTAPSTVDTSAWAIGSADGLSVLKITAPNGGPPVAMELTTTGPALTLDAAARIDVGAMADSPAAKATLVDARFNAIKAAIALIPPAADPASAITAVNALLEYFGTVMPTATVGATKVWVE